MLIDSFEKEELTHQLEILKEVLGRELVKREMDYISADILLIMRLTDAVKAIEYLFKKDEEKNNPPIVEDESGELELAE